MNIPNANKINWTLIASSSSDSASTQKRLNYLINERKSEDRKLFGPLCSEATELVENFCAMHLGVNLRKAFLCGMKFHTTDCRDLNAKHHRDRHISDFMVYEFCKLFGTHGVPEYGRGTSF